jgi:putative two-component system response regulator
MTAATVTPAGVRATSSAAWRPPGGPERAARIAIVDDEITNIKVLRKYLQTAGYGEFVTTTDAPTAALCVQTAEVDVVLLDVMMPGVSGLDVLSALRADDRTAHVPVIILTAATDRATRRMALERGATDFLAKPVDPDELVPRVRNALLIKQHQDSLVTQADRLRRAVAEQTAELLRTRREVVHCLARAAEYRDSETGRHVMRVGRYVGAIARRMGLDDELVELLELAAPLHDVGKIGIPDAILHKAGALTPEEQAVMRTHAGIGLQVLAPLDPDVETKFRAHANMGAQILGGGESQLLSLAARIAVSHHERWDGKGYPLGLAGEAIPLEGRITAVADVFDALSSRRPYKPAFPLPECVRRLEAERGTHFDPKVLDAFHASLDEIFAIHREYSDDA